MNTYDLNGRVAVVTGGSSGLGLAIVQRLVASGATCVVWDINADDASQNSHSISSYLTDISDYAAVRNTVELTVKKHGKIDLLVNCAGASGPFLPCHEYPLDQWDRQIAINLSGTFYCCRAVIPYMLQNEYGRIVNVSSSSGKEGNPLSSGYSASKAGVIGLTKTLGKELATSNIIVNCITPALMETPMHKATLKRMSPEMMDTLKSKIPMKRIGRPEELANMTAWLLSEECSFTTGFCFDLSGGRSTY